MNHLIHKLKYWLILIMTIAGSVVAVNAFNYATAAGPDCSGNNVFLGIPAWYRGLAEASGDTCEVKWPSGGTNAEKVFIGKIILNITDVIARLIGILAGGFIVYGGILYITAFGESSKVAAAKNTIVRAVVGLVIAILATGIVNFILGIFK